jgi:hypothetical protein
MWLPTSDGHIRAKHVVRLFHESNRWGRVYEDRTDWYTRIAIYAEMVNGSKSRLETFDFDEADPDHLDERLRYWLDAIVEADS